MRGSPGILMRAVCGVLLGMLLTPQVFAADDVGLPIHPNAIRSSIVRQSGKGEGTNWLLVTFKVNAGYEEVVKFYRKQTGRNIHLSKTESKKGQNTLILFAKDPKDQINVNISGKVGEKVTEVEITRNYVKP